MNRTEQETDTAQTDTVRKTAGPRVLLVLLLLLPLAILFFLPHTPLLSSTLAFWFVLLACWALLFWLVDRPASSESGSEAAGPRMLYEAEQPDIVREVMDVRVAMEESSGRRVFRGPLRESAKSAYEKLKSTLPSSTSAMVQADEELGAAILLAPQAVPDTRERENRLWVHWLLFALTVLTTTWAGAAHQGVDLLREPTRFFVGLPYSLGLMAILGLHELGHYFVARRHGIQVTPPYFIPIPFALGTFGAFIQMRSPSEDRGALFDVAVAGPLAGLVVAIPALLIGLQSSTVVVGNPAVGAGTSVGSSVLFALLAKLALGDALSYGHVLRLSPLAFAGWLGLFVTALNLLPIGQLDGGHMAHALFGRRTGETITSIAMWSLLLLGIFVWPGLMMWAVIVFFIAGRTVPPLNDLTPLSPGRRWLGYATFAILALILSPLPHSLWPAAGIHCPYM